MHHKLIYSKSGQAWETSEVAGGVLTTPQNEGFDASRVLGQIRAVHTCDEIDGDELSHDERMAFYSEAIVAAGTRYPIRQIFGSRRNPGIDSHFGTHIPALIVYEDDRPSDVFPHRAADGPFMTIRRYADSL